MSAHRFRIPLGYKIEGKIRMTERNALSRGIFWGLTKDQARKLVISPCEYCGEKADMEWTGNGIDRVDNNAGYVPDNCVPCCTMCNFMKYTHSKEKFLNHVKKIVAFNGEHR